MPPPPSAPLGGAVGLHLAHIKAGGGQECGDVPAESGRAFHPDPPDREREAIQQRPGLGEPLRCGRKRRHRAPPAPPIQHRDAEHVLVRVDPGYPVCLLHASLLSLGPVAARGGLGPADLG